MKYRFKVRRAVYLLLTGTLIAVTGAKLYSNKKITGSKVYIYDKESPVSVRAIPIQAENITEEYTFAGTFEPVKETQVTADIQGKITQVMAEEGNGVKKDEIIVRLDDSLMLLQLKEAELSIKDLERDVERYRVLAAADAVQGIQLEKLILGLEKAKIKKETLIDQIAKTQVKAPINGIITAKLNEIGGFAAPGVPLFRLTDISELKFTIFTDENKLHLFENNKEYLIVPDAYPHIELQAVLLYTGSKANPGNSFPIQFRVKNTPDLKIKAGMFGKVHFTVQSTQTAVTIPVSSISGTENKPAVFLAKNGKAALQNITISHYAANKAVVTDGLKPGDMLITRGFINLHEGANITTLKSTE